jgi:Ca2+-binding EF-hand superfamily protein
LIFINFIIKLKKNEIMLSNFQKRKLVALFNQQDSNQNGQLELSDFLVKADHFVALKGLGKDSEEHKAYTAMLTEFWSGLLAADTDGDGVISYEEWWAWWDQILTNGLYDQVAAPMGHLAFDLAGPDADATISKANFIKLHEAQTQFKGGGDEVFDHLSSDGKSISLEQMNALLFEFFQSNDVNAKGNWMFGRF